MGVLAIVAFGVVLLHLVVGFGFVMHKMLPEHKEEAKHEA